MVNKVEWQSKSVYRSPFTVYQTLCAWRYAPCVIVGREHMKVIKIGGGCLTDSETIGHILKLVAQRGHGSIFVLSALNGITDTLIDGMKGALAKEDNIPPLISHLRDKH